MYTTLAACLGSAIGFWWGNPISPWLSVATGLAVLTMFHMAFASSLVVALPHIGILIACLQYVFAAWIGFYYPPSDPTYDIGDRLPFYLAYAGPVILALVLGWGLSLIRLRPLSPTNVSPISRMGVLHELDLLLAIGMVSSLAGRFVHVPALGFVFLLLGNLRYIGVFGRMLLKGGGWTWRLAFVLGTQAFLAVGSTMFHDLLLWSAWTFAVWVYTFKPRPWAVIAAIILGVLFLPALQEAKWRLRVDPLEDDPVVAEQEAGTVDPLRAGTAWLSYLIPAFEHTITWDFDAEFLGAAAVRYNQGWIINRVMVIVPDVEPYAGGATLQNAVVAAVLPRIIAPNKFVAGGREHMAQYAGILLNDETAMTLGYAGEMYANFGLVGGAIGCGVYAFVFGMIFRLFAVRAFRSPLWWSLVPFIFYSALKAEDDIGFVLNWTTKAAIVAAGILIVLPNLRRALFARVPHNGALSNRPLITSSVAASSNPPISVA